MCVSFSFLYTEKNPFLPIYFVFLYNVTTEIKKRKRGSRMNEYSTLESASQALEEGTDFQTGCINDNYDKIYKLPYEQIVLLLGKIYERLQIKRDAYVEKLDKHREGKLLSEEDLKKITTFLVDERGFRVPEVLEKLKELQVLYQNNEILPIKKGKTYRWNGDFRCFMADTGERTRHVKSSKVKVLENSQFINAFHVFVLNPSILYREEYKAPYVLAKVSYGEWKGSEIFVPLASLEYK